MKALRLMMVIRFAEELIGERVSAGQVKTPCHLGIGQEAIAVGVCDSITNRDYVFGAHRSHAHFLALGGSAESLFAEILGRDTGCARGFGGSMHLYDARNGFMGSVPIVGGTISIAVGAAMAAKVDGGARISVCFFGDGATEEGVFHESLNLASLFQLPILFVCENNLFASHLHIDQRQSQNETRRFAQAHGVESDLIDGNDVVKVREVASQAIERMRDGGGPFFLEAVTYRWRGHVGPREDLDVGVDRKENLGAWKKRDPIRRLVDGLILRGDLTEMEFEALIPSIKNELSMAWEIALRAPFPEVEKLLSAVYK